MFAYCRNNPVKRRDVTGFGDKEDADGDGDFFEIEEYGGGGLSSYYYGSAEQYWTSSGSGGGTGSGYGSSSVSYTYNLGGSSSIASTSSAYCGSSISYYSNYSLAAWETGRGFGTYRQLKNALGSPGSGNEWHHIVEQCQVAKSGFCPQMIQNTNNIVPVSKTTHRAISGYYSGIQNFTNGMTVRNWLRGQSFRKQYEFGIDILNKYLK